MGALADATRLVQKYPLTFLAASAVAAVVLPVFSVSTAASLRPWAKRILSSALSVRREALRIAAESTETYADLLAEVIAESAHPKEGEPLARPTSEAAKKPYRAEPVPAESAAMPLA